MTDTKLNVAVVTLSTQHNTKLLKILESSFKRIINWNKYLPKTINQVQNWYSDFLINPRFQGVGRFFVVSFKDDDSRESHKQYYLAAVGI